MQQQLLAEAVNYAVYGGTFVGILLLFTGLFQLAQRGETHGEARSRRIRMIERGASAEEVFALLKPMHDRGLFGRIPALTELADMLLQAGFTIAPARFLVLCGVASGLVFLATSALLSWTVALLLAITLGLVLPVLVVKQRRDARVAKMVDQLPDALELMSRGLKVGHPLNTSIGAVASEMPDPIGTEFGLIFDQVSFGDDLTDAVQDFAERIRVEDVQYMAASIGIQHGTGGDLARVLSILATVIRERMAMRQRIRAISSEGRLTAIFLSALPVLIFVFTSITNPEYFGGVADDPLFKPMIAAIGTLTVLNFLVLRKLVRFRI